MLFQWWTSVWFVWYSLFGIEGVVSVACVVYTHQTRDIHPRMVQCWTGVVDDGPTLNRHLMNVSYLRDRSITSCCHLLLYPPPPPLLRYVCGPGLNSNQCHFCSSWLKYCYINQEIKGSFSILSHHKCLISISSFRFLWIPLVYGHFNYFTLFSARIYLVVQRKTKMQILWYKTYMYIAKLPYKDYNYNYCGFFFIPKIITSLRYIICDVIWYYLSQELDTTLVLQTYLFARIKPILLRRKKMKWIGL